MTRKMQFEDDFTGSKVRRNPDVGNRKPCFAIAAHSERDRHLEAGFGMRAISLLLVVCAAATGQSASAQTNNQPSLAALRAACAEDAQKLCAGVQPGGGRIVACLEEHKDSLSVSGKPVCEHRPSESGSDNNSIPGVSAH